MSKAEDQSSHIHEQIDILLRNLGKATPEKMLDSRAAVAALARYIGEIISGAHESGEQDIAMTLKAISDQTIHVVCLQARLDSMMEDPAEEERGSKEVLQ